MTKTERLNVVSVWLADLQEKYNITPPKTLNFYFRGVTFWVDYKATNKMIETKFTTGLVPLEKDKIQTGSTESSFEFFNDNITNLEDIIKSRMI